MRRAIVIGGAVLTVVVLGVAGYLLGRGGAATVEEADQARQEVRAATLGASQRDAYDAAFDRGQRDGSNKGRANGELAGAERGQAAGSAEAGEELAAIEAEEAAAAEAAAAEEPLICDGAIADDEHYAACLEQSGETVAPTTPQPDAYEPSPDEVCSDPALADAAGYSCP